MNDDTPYKILALVIIVFAAFSIGLILGKNVSSDKIKTEAIQRGFAEYNPTNGVWQWKESR